MNVEELNQLIDEVLSENSREIFQLQKSQQAMVNTLMGQTLKREPLFSTKITRQIIEKKLESDG